MDWVNLLSDTLSTFLPAGISIWAVYKAFGLEEKRKNKEDSEKRLKNTFFTEAHVTKNYIDTRALLKRFRKIKDQLDGAVAGGAFIEWRTDARKRVANIQDFNLLDWTLLDNESLYCIVMIYQANVFRGLMDKQAQDLDESMKSFYDHHRIGLVDIGVRSVILHDLNHGSVLQFKRELELMIDIVEQYREQLQSIAEMLKAALGKAHLLSPKSVQEINSSIKILGEISEGTYLESSLAS